MRRRRVEPEPHAAVLEALVDGRLLEPPGLAVDAELAARDSTREERPRVEHARSALVGGDGALDARLKAAHVVPVSERLLDVEKHPERMYLVVRAEPRRDDVMRAHEPLRFVGAACGERSSRPVVVDVGDAIEILQAIEKPDAALSQASSPMEIELDECH